MYYEELIKHVFAAKNRTKQQMKDAYLGTFSGRVAKNVALSIAILNAPCNGFGDVVFAMKLYRYLTQWYPLCRVTIITTNVEGFMSIGADMSAVVSLDTRTQKSCRRFSRLEVRGGKKEFDLYFVAPLQADFDISFPDVKKLFPQSNLMNTYFFSEYNDSSRKKFDFPTGIGGNRMGLFLTSSGGGNAEPPRLIHGPYAMVYIADIARGNVCFTHFMNMVCKKYHQQHPIFQLVVPSWIAANILDKKIHLDGVVPFFGHVVVVTKEKQQVVVVNVNSKSKSNQLIIRGDVYPLNNKAMMPLMKYSVRDILLTGDQSITDMLSCGRDKNLFYQIAPWKRSLATQLAIHLPNKYLVCVKTACGTMGAIHYKSNYSAFVRHWDFRHLGRQHLDNVMVATSQSKEPGSIYQKIWHCLLEKRPKQCLLALL